MKTSKRALSANDVRCILDDKLRETGLDQVPKRLDLLDKILTSVDELKQHKSAIDRIGKHLHLTTNR